MRARSWGRAEIATTIGVLALIVAVSALALIAREATAMREKDPVDHAFWIALATVQAATFAAHNQPRVAVAVTTRGAGRAAGGTPPATATATSRSPAVVAMTVPPPPPIPVLASAIVVATPSMPATSTPVARSPLTAAMSPTAPATAETPSAAPPFSATHKVVATLPVNMRARPGTSGAILATLAPGTPLMATGEVSTIGGQPWRRFFAEDGRQGWVLDLYVAPLESGRTSVVEHS